MATSNETINGYIKQFCTEIGTTPENVYNAENNAWYFTKGSASIEVFLTTYELSDKSTRTFVRVFSPIYPIPADLKLQLDLYQGALEANTQYMGVKIATIASKGYVYAIGERDIEGMDYKEFNTTLTDLGYWADQLDDFLKERFGIPQPPPATPTAPAATT